MPIVTGSPGYYTDEPSDLEPRVGPDEYRDLIVKQIAQALAGARRAETVARRYTLLSIGLSFLASASSVVTALTDEALLAVVPAVLASAVAALTAWLKNRTVLDEAKAHRRYANEVTTELRLYDAAAPPYSDGNTYQRFVVECERIARTAYEGIEYVL